MLAVNLMLEDNVWRPQDLTYNGFGVHQIDHDEADRSGDREAELVQVGCMLGMMNLNLNERCVRPAGKTNEKSENISKGYR